MAAQPISAQGLKVKEELLSWPGVTTRRMFGCDTFFAGPKMFAFLLSDGLVVKAAPEERDSLLARPNVEPMRMGNGVRFGDWLKVAIEQEADFDLAIDLAGRSLALVTK